MGNRKLIIAGGVVLLAIAGFFGTKFYVENKVRTEIRQALATMPEPYKASAGDIDVSFLDKNVTVHNLAFTGSFSAGEITVAIERLAAAGVNLDTFSGAGGIKKIANSIEMTNYKVTAPGVDALMAKYDLDNVQGDVALMSSAMLNTLPVWAPFAFKPEELQDNPAAMRALLEKMPALFTAMETFSASGMRVKDYTYSIPFEGKTMNVTLAGMEAGAYSMRRLEKLTIGAVDGSVEGKPLFHMDSMSIDTLMLPSFVPMFEGFAKTGISPHVAQIALKGQPFALRNFQIKNLRILDPRQTEKALFTLDSSVFSYDAEHKDHSLDYAYSGLTMPRELLASGKSAELVALLPETLRFEGGAHLLASAGQNGHDLVCKDFGLKEAALGSAYLDFSMQNLNVAALSMGMPDMASVRSASLRVADTGFTDVLFGMRGLQRQSSGAAERAKVLAEFATDREKLANDVQKNLLDTLEAFLQKSGSLMTMSMNPKQPVKAAEIGDILQSQPEKLGISASVTPVQ